MTTSNLKLGLLANWRSFTLLVIVNAFVGAMVGQERTLLPLIAEADFHLASRSVILSFLISFGIVKAVANLFAGVWADRLGRKPILVAGWLVGLPVPWLIMSAPNWSWVVFANVLLGVNQGLCWSATVIMKIDLVGPRRRGLAMGLNEFAGYLAVSASAFLTAYLATHHGLRPVPFYPGVAFAVTGLVLSVFLVHETKPHAALEASSDAAGRRTSSASFTRVLLLTSWRDRSLFAASQAGMVNNLNDGMAWGLLPLLFASAGLPLGRVGLLAAAYPAVWGISQLATGALSDRWGRKWMIAAGMFVQAFAIALFVVETGFGPWLVGSVLLGSARRWSTRRSSRPYRTSPIPTGGHRPWACIGCGATAATRSGRFSPECSPMPSGCGPRSVRSPA